MNERKIEKFEDDRGRWKIYFDIEKAHDRGDSNILVSFIPNRSGYSHLTEKDIEKLKLDLKDLGKLRVIKQGKGFLEKQ